MARTPLDGEGRALLDQVLDRWSLLILGVLCERPTRFNDLRRRVEGITQKSLTQALRRLERNGVVDRVVLATAPVAVEYRITPLGRTLEEPLAAVTGWTVERLPEVQRARARYDDRYLSPATTDARTTAATAATDLTGGVLPRP